MLFESQSCQVPLTRQEQLEVKEQLKEDKPKRRGRGRGRGRGKGRGRGQGCGRGKGLWTRQGGLGGGLARV